MFLRRLLCIWITISFVATLVIPPQRAYAQTVLNLPEPGTMVSLSSAYTPVLIKGLKINPNNPLALDFIVATGNSKLTAQDPELKKESEKLIKYFFAALTLPEKDVWVNLSPYEKDRIIPKATGETEMGRDMLAQDYILKQITASLIYPEKGLGKEFWNKIYTEAYERFGTTQVPVNTFNKVWIVADKASVYEAKDTVVVVDSHLKVMLEEDYMALEKHTVIADTHAIGSQIVREIVLPALEKEVNEGKNFANLRQIFHSLILAKWYKETLKNALLNQVYSNKTKVGGLSFASIGDPQYIYQQYLKAYKKGVFNYIKEDIDQATNQPMPRKYFSGGLQVEPQRIDHATSDEAMMSLNKDGSLVMVGSEATVSNEDQQIEGISIKGNNQPAGESSTEYAPKASQEFSKGDDTAMSAKKIHIAFGGALQIFSGQLSIDPIVVATNIAASLLPTKSLVGAQIELFQRSSDKRMSIDMTWQKRGLFNFSAKKGIKVIFNDGEWIHVALDAKTADLIVEGSENLKLEEKDNFINPFMDEYGLREVISQKEKVATKSNPIDAAMTAPSPVTSTNEEPTRRTIPVGVGKADQILSRQVMNDPLSVAVGIVTSLSVKKSLADAKIEFFQKNGNRIITDMTWTGKGLFLVSSKKGIKIMFNDGTSIKMALDAVAGNLNVEGSKNLELEENDNFVDPFLAKYGLKRRVTKDSDTAMMAFSPTTRIIVRGGDSEQELRRVLSTMNQILLLAYLRVDKGDNLSDGTWLDQTGSTLQVMGSMNKDFNETLPFILKNQQPFLAENETRKILNRFRSDLPNQLGQSELGDYYGTALGSLKYLKDHLLVNGEINFGHLVENVKTRNLFNGVSDRNQRLALGLTAFLRSLTEDESLRISFEDAAMTVQGNDVHFDGNGWVASKEKTIKILKDMETSLDRVRNPSRFRFSYSLDEEKLMEGISLEFNKRGVQSKLVNYDFVIPTEQRPAAFNVVEQILNSVTSDLAMTAKELGQQFIDENLPAIRAGKAAEVLIKHDATQAQEKQIMEDLKIVYDVKIAPVTFVLTESHIEQWYKGAFAYIQKIKTPELAQKDITAIKQNMVGQPLKVLIMREKDGRDIIFTEDQAKELNVARSLEGVKKLIRGALGVKKADPLNKVHMADSRESALIEMAILRDSEMIEDKPLDAAMSAAHGLSSRALAFREHRIKDRDFEGVRFARRYVESKWGRSKGRGDLNSAVQAKIATRPDTAMFSLSGHLRNFVTIAQNYSQDRSEEGFINAFTKVMPGAVIKPVSASDAMGLINDDSTILYIDGEEVPHLYPEPDQLRRDVRLQRLSVLSIQIKDKLYYLFSGEMDPIIMVPDTAMAASLPSPYFIIKGVEYDLISFNIETPKDKKNGESLEGFKMMHLKNLERRMGNNEDYRQLGNDTVTELVKDMNKSHPGINLRYYKGKADTTLFPYLLWQAHSHYTDHVIFSDALKWLKVKEEEIYLANKKADADTAMIGEGAIKAVESINFFVTQIKTLRRPLTDQEQSQLELDLGVLEGIEDTAYEIPLEVDSLIERIKRLRPRNLIPSPNNAMKVHVDHAVLANVGQGVTPGGIDLNASKIDMKKTGSGIDIKFDPAMIEQFKLGNFEGIVPVITGITPITDIYPLLGLYKPQEIAA